MERVQWNKKNVLKLSLNISIFCGWNLERNKRIIILNQGFNINPWLNDQLFYFFSTVIVFLIVIVITIKLYDQKNEIYWQNVFNFNQSLIAINSLITQSTCVYLDLLLHIKTNVDRKICWEPVNPNNPVVILRFAILTSSSDSADRGRSIIQVRSQYFIIQ